MTRFVRNVRVASSQLSEVAWRAVVEFEALCALKVPEVCQRKVFSTAYALRKTPQDVCYFVPRAGLIRLSSIWLTTIMACEIPRSG